MNLRVSFHTFGCKLNQVETEAIAEKFAAEGFIITEGQDADLFFVNTCAVTGKAEAKGRRLIRKLAVDNPGKVISAGCLSQLKPEEISSLGNLKMVLGTRERFNAIEYLKTRGTGGIYVDSEPKAAFSSVSGNNFRSRLFVKIQDGCSHRCSYCIVPHLRGDSVSMPVDQVISMVEKSLSNNPNEIVLTGVDIGSYCDEFGVTLSGLIPRLAVINKVKRIRLSSVEPPGFTDALIDACINTEKVCHHFHVPLQSGSDRILNLMKRDYTAEQYFTVIRRLADNFPAARIGTDVIVGFPGEKDSDFEETAHGIELSPLNHIHIFPFSPRPGTDFSEVDDDVKPEIKSERSDILRKIISVKYNDFLEQNMGRIETVFFEGDGSRGGLTGNYIRVFVENYLKPGFVKVRLIGLKDGKVIGEIVE